MTDRPILLCDMMNVFTRAYSVDPSMSSHAYQIGGVTGTLKTLSSWTNIYYVNPILENTNDGIRFHDQDQIVKLDRCIKSYLDIENIDYKDLTNVDLNDRVQYVINDLL